MYFDNTQEEILNILRDRVDKDELISIQTYFGLKDAGQSAGSPLYRMLEDILAKYGAQQ
ncbi:hypothetical protein FACS1894190_14130 [Spirochaetia bacterium]|nr:hypothetical protein FACS1894190_14130 [Spirochaetia bacterium]